MSMREILLRGVRIAVRDTDKGYRAQVLPLERRHTEPIVLAECQHDHRLARRARDCAAQLAHDLGKRHGVRGVERKGSK